MSNIGSITAIFAATIALAQKDVKRVLAYSTIANLGLIVMCAGVGNGPAVWAAIMLIIFHAVAKCLLFLGVGTIEHKSGSRDIEDMDGLLISKPGLGIIMIVGILGMFLAPFGMLISKWACLEALIAPGSFPPILVVLLAYGSAPTLFFWAKWLGKIVSFPVKEFKLEGKVGADERFVLGLLAILTVLASGLFPLIAAGSVDPYISSVFGVSSMLGRGDTIIMLTMLALMIVLPLGFAKAKNAKLVKSYLAGANIDGSAAFLGAMGVRRDVVMRNYYLTGFFNEANLTRASVWITVVVICAMLWAAKL
jgi:ech hydrogenase subunit A